MDVRPATAGPDGSTRQRVATSILVNGGCTAAYLAEQLRLTPAAVRRHLDQLLDDGLVTSRPARSRGTRGRGRPAKEFVLTDAGRDSFDQQYDDLALAALRFVAETGGEDAVREFARRQMSFIETGYAALEAERPGDDPAALLAQVFSDQGYAASTRSGPVGEQLCQQHCPVSHVAHQFPQLCEAETEAIGRVVGSHVQRLATIAHGDGVCTTCIPQPHESSTDSTPGHGNTDRDHGAGTGGTGREHKDRTPHDRTPHAPAAQHPADRHRTQTLTQKGRS